MTINYDDIIQQMKEDSEETMQRILIVNHRMQRMWKRVQQMESEILSVHQTHTALVQELDRAHAKKKKSQLTKIINWSRKRMTAPKSAKERVRSSEELMAKMNGVLYRLAYLDDERSHLLEQYIELSAIRFRLWAQQYEMSESVPNSLPVMISTVQRI